MKILCISDAWLPQINGVVRTYQNIGGSLEKMGHSFEVIGPSDFKWTIPAPTYPDIRLVLLASLTLPEKIRTAQADSIHIATEGPLGRAARRYCLAHDIPFTTCYHSQFPDYLAARMNDFIPALAEPLKKAAIKSLRHFHSSAALTMVATESLEDYLKQQGYTERFHRFIRGIDSSIYHPGERTLFNDLKRPVALYVGRVSVEKNLEAFLDAKWDGSKVIVGDGPALNDLQSRYPDAVFTGVKTGQDLAAHYRSADVFAFPSKTDTFGIVLIEALASGLPVAAYPVSGPIDIINDDRFGALYSDFGTALQQALQAPGTALDRSALASGRYTWDLAARQFLDGVMQAQK